MQSTVYLKKELSSLSQPTVELKDDDNEKAVDLKPDMVQSFDQYDKTADESAI